MTLDPVAALMLDEAGPLSGRVLVVDDVDGGLTRAAAEAGADVRTWCDDLRDLEHVPPHLRLSAPPSDGWTPELTLLRLPKSVAALEDYAEHLALVLEPSARVVAGGRIKHMTPTQNAVLHRQFTQVRASLGRQKSRVLHASGAAPAARRWPSRRHHQVVGVTAIAHGPVFNTSRLDDGTHLLLRTLARSAGDVVNDPRSSRGIALDVGCGSGIIATWLAQRGWATTATDVSYAATRSASLTAQANGVTVRTRRADMLAGTRTNSVDLLVSNPPFHIGAAKDSTPTLGMIRDAGRVLRRGGELWLVFNAHLPYLAAMRQHVGNSTVEAQDRHYIVARALKEPRP